METKYGFIKMNIDEFNSWLLSQRVGRTVNSIQQHHTFSPSYSGFTGDNHFTLQKSMRNYHVNHNGWSDLGQHFTTFPDGMIVTGRSLERSPAGIYGSNANSICIEHLGNFDVDGDEMNDLHSGTITEMTASLCVKFNIPRNVYGILYHHWFNLVSGERNNGTGSNKSCPGTNFFHGNKVEDCQNNFLPVVETMVQRLNPSSDQPELIKYSCVTANKLNVRTGPDIKNDKAAGRAGLTLGAIIRVYDEINGWLKISNSQSHWVSARYTSPVQKAVVNANKLNARSGPGKSFSVIGSYLRGQEIFIESDNSAWGKINMEDKWVSKSYLNILK